MLGCPRTLLLLAPLALLLASAVAHAHPQPVDAVPAARGVYTVGPAEARIVFSEAIEPSASLLELDLPNGSRVRLLTQVEGLAASAVLPPLDEGRHVLAWRVLSRVDGHAYEGSHVFAVGNPAVWQPRLAAERDPAVRGSPLDLASGATFALSLAALLGAPLAGILVWRPQVRAGVDEALARAVERRFLALWIAGFALAAVSAALLGAGAGPPAPGVGGHGGPTTERGTQASLRLALLAYAFAVLGLELGRMALAERRDRLPWTWPVAVGAGLVLAAASALLGHLGAQGWTPALLDLVHTILGTVWIGGVAFLALVVVPAASLLEEATRRGLLASCARAFTPVATSCVAGVVATGVVATLALAGGLEGLTTTAWGWVLLAKVALVAVVLAFGARNRRFGQGRGSGPRSFARAVGAEAALGAAVLVAAGLLTALVPPVSEVAAAPGEPPEYHILRHADDDGVLTVAILPATAGAGATRYDVDVFLSGPLASALPQARVSVDGPDPRDLAPLRSVRPGHARVEAVPLSEGDALAIAIDDRTWRFGRVFD